MKRYILIIIAICAMSTVMAKAPEKDAVYKLISESYTLNTDGSTEFRKRTELQIFTRMTFDHFGETFITYNPDFQELIINEAYTIRKDGSKVETPENAFNPMLPEGCTKCERLNGIRTMVVTHTALEYDAVIVLDYTIRSKNFFFQELLEKVDLQEEVPVEKYVVSVTAPDYKPAKFQLNGENLVYTKTETTDKDFVTTVYTFSNLPERPTDEYLFPSVYASLTFFTMDKAENLVGKMAQQNSMQKFDNQKITDFFKSRFTDEMNVMDKILYVRDYIHDNIQTNHLDASVLNYMFASPQQVWESNCALPIEKNILLAGVLQSLGNDAQLAFMGNSLASDLKTVVRIQRNGATDYISANEIEELSLDAFFAPATLIMQDGKIENVTAQPVSVERVAEITLESGKLDDPVVKMEQKVESPQMKYLQVHGTGATEVSVSQLTGKYYEMTIDDGQYGTPIRSVNIHNDRKYDVDTKESSEKYGYAVKLPANVRCLTKTSHKEITVEGAKLLIDVVVGGNTVMITRTLSLPKEGISSKSSKKFKAMMGEWEAPVKVVFSL
ncbi:MAG: DUF3857 domain-containing protein [Bacteroidales bacterium]|nr:DUF3857 domain-containing protein [Bacteroidales bacterium]